MIYEGAVIRRLVTPNQPGDPTLDDPDVECQFRVEFVKDDATAPAPGSWTREIAAAHVYPRHLDADKRAQKLGEHCLARVLRRDETSAPAQNNLPPVDGSSSLSARESSCPTSLQANGVTGVAPDVCSNPRAAGGKIIPKKRARKQPRGRMAALRLAAERVANREAAEPWYNKGQYA